MPFFFSATSHEVGVVNMKIKIPNKCWFTGHLINGTSRAGDVLGKRDLPACDYQLFIQSVKSNEQSLVWRPALVGEKHQQGGNEIERTLAPTEGNWSR